MQFEVKLQLELGLPIGTVRFAGTSKVKPTQNGTHGPILYKMTENKADPYIFHYRVIVESDSLIGARTTAIVQAIDHLEKNIQHDKTK